MDNRLKELQILAKDNPYLDDNSSCEDGVDEFLKRTETIRSRIVDMRKEIDGMREIYDEMLQCVDSKNMKKYARSLENLADMTNINNELKQLVIPTGELTTKDRIKQNIYTSLAGDFSDAMAEYQYIQNKYNEERYRLVKTQVLLVNPDATNEEIETAIGSRSIFVIDNGKEALDYVKNKHEEILKLQQKIEGVHKSFADMQVLAQIQSETINRISYQVSTAKKEIVIATEELREAKKIKRKTCIIT